MPGTQAQNVMRVALDEQLPPARTGVPVGLALALAAPLADVAAPPDELGLAGELEPPLLHAASSVIAAMPASPAASRAVLLWGIPFDNIWGSFAGLLSSLLSPWGWPQAAPLPCRVSG
jgi:hypothetical protein